MVESKRKNLAAVDAKNNNTLEFSSNITVDSVFNGEDDWIVVKKQRVNILIPPLPSNELSMEPHPEKGLLHGTSSSMINTPELPQNQPLEAQVAERNDGSIRSSPELNIQSSPNVLNPVDNAEPNITLMMPDLRRLNAEDQVGSLTAIPRKTECPPKICVSSRRIRTSIQSGLSGACNFSTSTMNVSNKIRALNLERNIVSAGGLGRWLSSLGLQQFERLFHTKNVSKYCLVNLSMKKLKDMGVHAVGPRRKLIHALESVSQPCCYNPSKNLHHQLRQ